MRAVQVKADVPCPFLEAPDSPSRIVDAGKDALLECSAAPVLSTPPRRVCAKRKAIDGEVSGPGVMSPGAPESETPGKLLQPQYGHAENATSAHTAKQPGPTARSAGQLSRCLAAPRARDSR